MKLLILLFLSFTAYAENWARMVEMEEGSVRGFQLQSACEEDGKYVCKEITSCLSPIYDYDAAIACFNSFNE